MSEWLPEAPPNWRSLRNKAFMREVAALSATGEEEMLSVSHLTGVTPRSEKTVYMFEAESTVGYKRVSPGDLVINTMWAWMGAAGIARVGGIVSPAYGVYRIDASIVDQRWIDYVIRTPWYITEMTRHSRGVTSSRLRLYPDEFLRLSMPVPPLAEQRAIADYLDAETARIDALIARKQRLIHLLEERRSAFIGAAVTRGLGNRVMLETGNELVPEVPMGWRLLTLRRLVERIVDTPHKTAPVIDDQEFLVVRTANVKSGRLVYTDARYTDQASWKEWNRKGEPRPGDVLFTREAPAGEACVVPADQPLCLGQRMVLLQVDRRRTSGEWLVHSIYSGPAQRFIEVYSNSTTVAHLNMSDIPDIPVVVPPLPEQAQLLELITQLDLSVRSSTQALLNQIGLLAEHRQALITAAVTGEFAVPGAA